VGSAGDADSDPGLVGKRQHVLLGGVGCWPISLEWGVGFFFLKILFIYLRERERDRETA